MMTCLRCGFSTWGTNLGKNRGYSISTIPSINYRRSALRPQKEGATRMECPPRKGEKFQRATGYDSCCHTRRRLLRYCCCFGRIHEIEEKVSRSRFYLHREPASTRHSCLNQSREALSSITAAAYLRGHHAGPIAVSSATVGWKVRNCCCRRRKYCGRT